MYRLTASADIIRIADGATIPADSANSDRQLFMAWLAAGNEPLPAPAPTLAERITWAVLKIDADTDALIRDVIGERGNEYKLADEHARSFKAAGYAGTVPASVQCWADATGWTATQAADDIIATSNDWLGAQDAIRANRLARKEDARRATDAAGVDAALTAWATFLAQMRAALGV